MYVFSNVLLLDNFSTLLFFLETEKEMIVSFRKRKANVLACSIFSREANMEGQLLEHSFSVWEHEAATSWGTGTLTWPLLPAGCRMD